MEFSRLMNSFKLAYACLNRSFAEKSNPGMIGYFYKKPKIMIEKMDLGTFQKCHANYATY
jgi:hypothetical protein